VKGSPADDQLPDGRGLRVAVVAARFNLPIVERLAEGAVGALHDAGVDADDVALHWVPGAFELPVILAELAQTGVDALVAVGAVVRGDTPHFDYVAGEAAHGASRVALDHGLPVGFGVLTTDTWEQAEARAGGAEGNKGAEAALAAVETAVLLRTLRATRVPPC
jgi:6,7-dimethyl-8-ribityllumazine synthase